MDSILFSFELLILKPNDLFLQNVFFYNILVSVPDPELTGVAAKTAFYVK